MSREPHTPESEEQLRLRTDLGRLLDGSGVDVPARIDEHIREAARGHFRGLRAGRRRQWWAVSGVAAAAVLVVTGVILVRPLLWSPPAPPVHVQRIPSDVDGNGRVDILDAFALARRVESGESMARELDLNRDGAVDGDDVELIALIAVAVEGGAG